jgi:hypothetical protein
MILAGRYNSVRVDTMRPVFHHVSNGDRRAQRTLGRRHQEQSGIYATKGDFDKPQVTAPPQVVVLGVVQNSVLAAASPGQFARKV